MEKENNGWLIKLGVYVLILSILIITPFAAYKPKPVPVKSKSDTLIFVTEESLRKSFEYRNSLINDARLKRLEIMNNVNLKK